MDYPYFDDFVRGTRVVLVSPEGEHEARWDIVRPNLGAQELILQHMQALTALNTHRAPQPAAR